MMSPITAIPVILLISSIVSTDAYVVISKIPNELNKQNSYLGALNTSNGDKFSNTEIEAIANDFQTFEGSIIGVDVDMTRKGSNVDDDRPKWNQLTKTTAKNRATNEEFSTQIEAAHDLDTFGEDGAKFYVYMARHSNLGDDMKEVEIPNWIKRVKRDFEYVWDNCPEKTSLQFVDDVLKCLPDNDQGGLVDKIFEPLQNGNCPTGQRRVQLGRATVCIEDRRRRKNG